MARYPLFVKRDIDGFFGLAVDNLVQLLLIAALCGAFCGMTGENGYFLTRHIMPGVAVSILIGNVFYALLAHWVAWREKRSDVTALPYGINTPSLLVYVFFVMKPTFDRTGSAELAWQMGLIACLGSGVIEFLGAFVAERLRRNTPRAALLATLAGIAITFISMTFALQIWQRPLVAMVPLAIVLLVYFSQVRFPLGLPGGLIAILAGTALGWLLPMVGAPTGVAMDPAAVSEAWADRGQYWPIWVGPMIWQMLQESPGELMVILSVVIPMGLFNVLGSLQNIESAEAGGDVFPTGPSLAVNGLGTIAAALFGSCFPTTIYIGHPGWKAMGARAGYSTLNGVFITVVCLTGTVSLISASVPIEAGIAIVLWIGVVITAQAFQTSPLRHAPAAAIGLFPAIAAWGLTIVAGAFVEANRNPLDGSMRLIPSSAYPVMRAAAAEVPPPTSPATWPTTMPATQPGAATSAPAVGSTAGRKVKPPPDEPMRLVATTMEDLLRSDAPFLGKDTQVSGFWLYGLILLERGYIFTCMIIAAISAFLIDRRYDKAAGWALAAAVLTFLGLMHAFELTGNQVDYLPLLASVSEGAYADRAFLLAIGYVLMATVFVVIGYLDRNRQRTAGDTLSDARVSGAGVADDGVADDGVADDDPPVTDES